MKSVAYRSALFSAAALSALSFCLCGTARAADAQGEGVLGEVVVTAQRREESLQRTPVAVTALGEQQLVQRNVQTTLDLQQTTPNLQVATQTAGAGTSSATFFIRGLGQQRSGNNTQPAVGVYVDDFYYPSLSGNLFRVLDVQQLEVLRGPQGTLFGRNTIGGAVRYTTRHPTANFGGYVDGIAGSRDHYDLTGMINVPVNDKVFLRASGGTLNQNGFNTDAQGVRQGDTKSAVGRAQLRVLPTDKLTVDLSATYVYDNLKGIPSYVPAVSGVAPYPLAWNRANPANPYDSRYVSACFYCQPASTAPTFARSYYNAYQAAVTWDVSPNLTIKSLTGQNNVRATTLGDADRSPLPILLTYGTNKVNAFSQEFQFNGHSSDARLNWVGGLYYYDAKEYSLADSTGVPPATNISSSQGETKSYAAYLQATYKFTDKLSATAGIRQSKEKRTISARSLTAGAGQNQAEWNDTSPLFSVQYQWTPEVMTYASASRGFRGGGFNATLNPALPNGGITPFDPESVWSYEIGARMDLLGHRLRLNPTVFYTDYQNVQLQAIFPAGTSFSLQVENAAKGRIEGAELEAVAVVTRDFELHGSLSTLDAKYTQLGQAIGITINSKFERSPKWAYTLGARYNLDLATSGAVAFNLDWAWTDKQMSTPTDLDAQVLPAYGVANARIQYTPHNARWYVAAYVRNLGNKKYFIGGTDFRQFSGPNYFDVGARREFGVNVRANF